jgi:hypothetical protein
MFVLATDTDDDILPGHLPEDESSTIIPGAGGIQTGHIKIASVKALVSIVEVLAYLQMDEFSEIDVMTLNKLIANFRMKNFALLQMKKDLNTVLDDFKNSKASLTKQQQQEKRNQHSMSKNIVSHNIYGDEVILNLFSNKEIKPHYLQHIPTEIKYFSGHRAIRDTELLEYFIGHSGLKDLWDKISKRYGTDKIELLKQYLSVKHAEELYLASENRWTGNETWRSKTPHPPHLPRSSDLVKSPSISKMCSVVPFEPQYLMSDQSAIHPLINQEVIMRNLTIFFGDDSIKNKYVNAYRKFRNWSSGRVGSRCALCKGLSLPAGNGFDKYLIHADRNYIYKKSSSDLHQGTIPIFSLVEAEIYDSQSKTLYTTVVRILAILRFRSPIFGDIKNNNEEVPNSISR